MLTAAIAAAANGSNEIVAAATGYKYRVLAFKLSFGGTVNAKWQSAATDLTGLMYGSLGVVNDSPPLFAPQPSTPPYHFVTAGGEALNLNLSTNVAVGGYVIYEKVPATL